MRSLYLIVSLVMARHHHSSKKSPNPTAALTTATSCLSTGTSRTTTSSISGSPEKGDGGDPRMAASRAAHAGQTESCNSCLISISSTISPTTSATTASPLDIVPTLPLLTVSSTSTTSVMTLASDFIVTESITSASTVSSIRSSSQQGTNAIQSNPSSVLSSSTVEECYKLPGGVQEDGSIDAGCGVMLAYIQGCHDFYDPGDNLTNEVENSAFQTCVCATSKDKPFKSDNVLYRNFTGCAACLLATKIPNFEFLSTAVEEVRNFCRSQNPFPYAFYWHLHQRLIKMQDLSKRHASGPTSPLTRVWVDSMYFITEPPLANLAYGASAPEYGSLAEVTPSLTTLITKMSNPTGCCSVSATVTSLVEWIPTQAAQPYDSKAAARSEVRAESSILSSQLCYGGGNWQCNKNDAVEGKPPMQFLRLVVVFAAALPLAGTLLG